MIGSSHHSIIHPNTSTGDQQHGVEFNSSPCKHARHRIMFKMMEHVHLANNITRHE
ncbi:MAG: hypothetical protein GYA24_15005 [Candidatus Lokiarchaeota archaeon]|nr:hypothetical protein [Candidatus Lokiarchaeota archaeon]